MYDDRLEIYSPGGMMDGTLVQNPDVMNVPSRRRNPVIADIFNRLQFMDRRGSGFKKIVEDYKLYESISNAATPLFRSEHSSFFITLPNLQYVIKKEDGTRDGTKAFNAIVEHMLNNPQVTIDELVSLTRISRRQMVRYINELSDKGVIRREGGRKLGKWVVIKQNGQ